LNIVTDEQILATADPALMFDKRLQLAHDRMLLLPDPPQTEEYGKAWREYLAAGGDRSMRDKGGIMQNKVEEYNNYLANIALKEHTRTQLREAILSQALICEWNSIGVPRTLHGLTHRIFIPRLSWYAPALSAQSSKEDQ